MSQQSLLYYTTKRDALKGTLDTINNMPKFRFVSRHPFLSEPEFIELLLRNQHVDMDTTHFIAELEHIKNKIRTKAEALGIRPNYNVQAVTSLEDKINNKEESYSVSCKNYEEYLKTKDEWNARREPLEYKLYRLTKKIKDLTQFFQEAEWYERYKTYADEHAIKVDDENIYRMCNRHRISQLIESEFGPSEQVTIDPAVDTCIGYIMSEDPEIFAARAFPSPFQSPFRIGCSLRELGDDE